MRAFRLEETTEGPRGRLIDLDQAALTGGDTLLRTHYAGINYKDALAGTGRAPIARMLPLNAGIEAVAEVVESADPGLGPGTMVIAHGMGLGVDRDGGLADALRADAEWLVRLPESLGPREAAALGVAGYTAALAVDRLEQHGVQPGAGPIAVTGATGGVGSHTIAMLHRRGFEVEALTSKPEAAPYLRDLGATRVASPPTPSGRPLASQTWAGAIDSVGGPVLAALLKGLCTDGLVASIGNAGANGFETTVLPFILRGVTLAGINANSPPKLRRRIWSRIGGDLRPDDPAKGLRLITPDEIGVAMAEMVAGRSQGRAVVAFAGAV